VLFGGGYTEFAGFPVCSPKNHWVSWLIHKAKTEEPKVEVQQHQTGLIGEEHRSDRCAMTQPGIFEAEDMRRDHKALLTVDYRIKVRLDLQANKSSVVVKGPFFP
jgi:hypothetical protein